MNVRRAACAVIAVMAMAAGALNAQPPIQNNTVVHSFTQVSGSPWVADIWTYTDPMGREFALVCQGNTGISCYEITNPAAPVFASSLPVTSGSDLKDVKVFQNYAYALQQSGGTQVIDLSNPYAMVRVNTITGTAHNGFFKTDGATPLYLQARNGANPANLRIYDVSSPANPVQIGSWNPPSGDTHDVYAEGNIAYVSVLLGNADGTYILDISNPASPVLLSVAQSGAVSHQNWLYTAPGGQKFCCTTNETAGGNLKIFDVTDPTNPQFVSQYTTPTGANYSVHNALVIDRYCFLSYYADYFRVIDLARPAQPVEVGVYDPAPFNAGLSVFDGAWGVAVSRKLPNGDYRCVMTESFSGIRGFWVLDFTPPKVPEVTIGSSLAGDFSLDVGGYLPGTEIYNPISLITNQALGAGGVVGLQPDALQWLIYPVGAQPFHVLADSNGEYDFSLPAGSLPPGLSFDIVSAGLTTDGLQWSQNARLTY